MKNEIIFIGDSHSIHCFADGSVDVNYVIDITLNKIRQHNSDVLVKYEGFFPLEYIHKYEIKESGDSLVGLINESNYKSVLLTIGEIDIRFHNSKLINDDVFEKTLESFTSFLRKINKNIILMSIIPPGLNSNHSENSDLNQRISLTKKMNSYFMNLCSKNNYFYFDIHDDFVKDEILDSQKSDGGVHISKNFQNYILEKLKNYIL